MNCILTLWKGMSKADNGQSTNKTVPDIIPELAHISDSTFNMRALTRSACVKYTP